MTVAPASPASPPVPSRSAPEADFDVKMYALFKWLTDDVVPFMDAWRDFMAANHTVFEDALDGVAIGQSDPAAGKFTALIADSLSGAAVQSSPGDTTAARALLVGAFGLGGYTVQAPAQNFDQIADRSGMFHVDSGGVNKPSFAANFSLLSLARSTTTAAQMAFALNSGTAARGRAAIRSKTGTTTWTDWFEVFTQNSILGPVSETGGMPTGAVIESGSNANGSYTRFADGTQICTSPAFTADATTALGQIYKWAVNQSWTYPAAFAATPVVSPGHTNNTSLTAVAATATITTVDINVISSITNTGRTATAMAIGRWF